MSIMKHISDSDLDGFGCTLLSTFLAEYCVPKGSLTVNTTNVRPGKAMRVIRDVIEHLDDYTQVVITDLAVNQEMVDLILNSANPEKFRVFDHHVCDIPNLPENFTITSESPIHPGKNTCATELFYHFIKQDMVFDMVKQSVGREALPNMSHFVNVVRIYDTYEFWEMRNDPDFGNNIAMSDATRLNTLFHLLEKDDFCKYIFDYFKNEVDWMLLTYSSEKYPYHSLLIDMETTKMNKYLESSLKKLLFTPFNVLVFKNGEMRNFRYTCGIVFAERHGPAIGNAACERNPNVDFCAVVNNNQVTFYTIKSDVNVAEIAKIFGGGGHPEAAGFSIPYQDANIFSINHFHDIISCVAKLTDPREIGKE